MPAGVRICQIAGAMVIAIAVAVTGSVAPAAAAPTKPEKGDQVQKITDGRVMPLPAGKWAWSAGFGVPGDIWASGHHTGQDLSATEGTAVLAAEDGVVVFTGNGGPYGNLTRIKHADGNETWYAHQSLIITKVGDDVRGGQVIGAVGCTGNCFGPHLHFEVRVNGQAVDPKPWLEGAPAVAAPDLPPFDPAVADQLRGDLARAEANREEVAADVAAADKQVAELGVKIEAAEREVAEARAALAGYSRQVYMAGVDPEWLLQVDALTADNIAQYADRAVLLQYANQTNNTIVTRAINAVLNLAALKTEVDTVQAEAKAKLDRADLEMADVQARLDASEGMWMIGSTFDGVVPKGGSPAALKAVKFALSQVGAPYNPAGGTGPTYGCNGFSWRAWKEAGSQWPLQMANDQALNQKWVVPVEPGKEAPGDLIFFRMNNGTDAVGRIDHVGLVVNPEKGVFVHASSPRTGVEINNYKSTSYYRVPAGFGRVVMPKEPEKDKKPQNNREAGSSKPRSSS